MNDALVEILLVEDNPDDVELAMHALREHNLANRVEIARDGEEALAFLFGEGEEPGTRLHRQPRLILLDLKLPKVDGLEVLAQLKADRRTKRIPVVILTTSSQEPDIEKAYELGANSYIVKPVDFEQFIDVVRQLGFYWLLLNKSAEK